MIQDVCHGPRPIYARMFAHAIHSHFSSCLFLLIQTNQKICRNPGTPEKMPSQKKQGIFEATNLFHRNVSIFRERIGDHEPQPTSRGYRSALLGSMVSRPGLLDFAKNILQEGQLDIKSIKMI